MAEWYYVKGGEKQGPIDTSALKRLAVEGTLLPTDMIWRAGLTEWTPAAKAKGLFPDPAGAVAAPAAVAAPIAAGAPASAYSQAGADEVNVPVSEAVQTAPVASSEPTYQCATCHNVYGRDNVYSENGVVICKQCYANRTAGVGAQQAGFVQPMPGNAAYPPAGMPLGAPASAQSGGGTSMIVAGYICAAVSLIFCPFGFAAAGIAIGTQNIRAGRSGHGTAQIILSIVCGILGVIFGVVANTMLRHR